MAANNVNIDAVPPAPQAGGRGGGRRGRGGRRGGRGGGNPRLNQAPPEFLAGPPRPQHLATTATPLRNDPLWMGSVCSSVELQPMPNIQNVYSGCEHLPVVTSVAHQALVSSSNSFSRRVPSSAVSYYFAVCTWARMLRLHLENGYSCSPDEERFVEQVNSLNLRIPTLLAHYLAGFGNTRVPNGRDIRFRLSDRTYQRIGEMPGWFGRVSAASQPLYQSYPCLAVYASKLLADVSRQPFQAFWQLPDEIRPLQPGAVGPTAAMLGFGPRLRTNEQQKAYLEGVGISSDYMPPSANPELPLFVDLLLTLQTELDAVDGIRKSPIPAQCVGSQGQLCAVLVEDEIENPIATQAVAFSPFSLPGEISFSASAFGYRPIHLVEDSLGDTDYDREDFQHFVEHAPWCIYHFEQGYPLGLVGNGNNLREREPSYLGSFAFRSSPYLIRSKIEALERALNAVRAPD